MTTLAHGQDLSDILEDPPGKETVCMVLPLSGPHAVLGRRIEAVIRGTLDKLGFSGGLRTFDTRGTIPGAEDAVTMAESEGCITAIGGIGDLEAVAVAGAAERAGLPVVVLGLEPDPRTLTHVVWARTPREEPIEALAMHLAAVHGDTRASLLYPNSAYGCKVAQAFSAAFQATGGRLLIDYPYPAWTEEMRGVAEGFASKWKDAASDAQCQQEVLFIAGGLEASRRLVAFLRYEEVLGTGEGRKCMPTTVAGTALWDRPTQLAAFGDGLSGAMFAGVSATHHEGRGDGAILLEAEVADAAGLVAVLMESGAGKGREGVMEALKAGPRWKGTTGELSVRADRVIGRRIVIHEIFLGAARQIDSVK